MVQGKGANGYRVEGRFRCLLLQFMAYLSDRETERYLVENLAAKWFCGLTLSEPTPDYSVSIRALAPNDSASCLRPCADS